MKSRLVKFQIGKSGITPGVTASLTSAFKNRKQVRVSVLKSAGRNKEHIKEVVAELEKKLPFKFNHRIIGFTIIIIKKSSIKHIVKKTIKIKKGKSL